MVRSFFGSIVEFEWRETASRSISVIIGRVGAISFVHWRSLRCLVSSPVGTPLSIYLHLSLLCIIADYQQLNATG